MFLFTSNKRKIILFFYFFIFLKIVFIFHKNYKTIIDIFFNNKRIIRCILSQNKIVIEHENELRKLFENNKIRNTNLISATNYGFRDLTINWIKSLHRNNITKFIIFCFDLKVFEYLKENHFDSNIFLIPDEWLKFELDSNSKNYGEKDYVLMMNLRLQIYFQLLLRNYNILFSDTDAIWCNNFVIEHLELIFNRTEAHALFAQDSIENQNIFCMGFFYLKPTFFNKKIFLKLVKITEKNIHKLNEQTIFNHIIPKSQVNNKIIGLDLILYPNGEVFFKSKLNKKFNVTPFVVHSNYIIGKETKINALKEENLWFNK